MKKTIVIANRLNWIDWAKTFAILFVVFGHIPEERGSFVLNYIVLFHMPFFFFISGYLTKKEYFGKKTLNKYWQTLIIPYLCFNIIFYPYWVAKHFLEYPNAVFFDFIKPIIGVPLLQFCTPISESLNGVTWFIAALLVMKIILSLCNNYKHGHLMMTILSIIVAIIYIINEYYRLYTDLPFVGFVKCLPFFYLGHLCKQHCILSERPQKKDILICIAGILISLFIYSYERATSGLVVYGICFWGICITAISGFLSLFRLMDKIHLTIIDNISIGTIVIMGLQWIYIGVTNYMLEKLLHIDDIIYSLWEAILLTLLFAAVSYPIILLIKNKFPFMLGKQITIVPKVSSDSDTNQTD